MPTELAMSVEISGFKHKNINAKQKSSKKIFSSAFTDVEMINEFEDRFLKSDISTRDNRAIKKKDEII